MSNPEEPKGQDKVCQTNVPVIVQTVSLDKVTQTQDPQSITINFYASNVSPKIDKPIQTDSSCTELVLRSSSSFQNGQPTCKSKEISNTEQPPIVYKRIVKPSNESKRVAFMNSRKVLENRAAARAVGDLERKKLEAELKATEELAKIQKTVIEKRLALELASLQDGSNSSHTNQPQQRSSDELQSLQELAKKQKLFESFKRIQESDSKTEKHPPPRPPQPTKMPLTETPKIFKTESSGLARSSSELNPLRHLLEKKLNLDLKPSSKTSFLKISPPSTHSASRERKLSAKSDKRDSESNDSSSNASDEPGCSSKALRSQRTRSIWRSAFLKIKKKVASKSLKVSRSPQASD